MKNSLSAYRPDLAEEWSFRNLPLTPDDVSFGSHKQVWWHGPCGHEWQAVIKSRAIGQQSGCPYCANRRVLPGYNDLSTRFPNVAEEWSDRNAPLKPNQVAAYCNRKVWWKGKCGHEWQSKISDRSSGHGCPYCRDHKLLVGFNDFATLYPELVSEWSDKNAIRPDQIPGKKQLSAWWKCRICKGEYQAWITSRLQGSKCPYCSGQVVHEGINDLMTTDPEIAQEWDYEKNAGVLPTQVLRSSRQYYWWKSDCGHEWKAKVSDRTIEHIPCTECEKDFLGSLPELLILLYTRRSDLSVVFGDNKLTGLTIEVYIPDLAVAIDHESSVAQARKEQAIKKRVCASVDIEYCLIPYADTPYATGEIIRDLFRKHNVFLSSDLDLDIAYARKQFRILSMRKRD